MAKKFVPIELDKTRNLRFGMQALMKLEDKLGRPMSSIDFDKEIKYRDIATIIWAGLVHEDKDLSVDGVAELIDEYSEVQIALECMSRAMAESFGGNDKGKK